MKRDGTETRENGNKIVRTRMRLPGMFQEFTSYRVWIKQANGEFSISRNNPWDYLSSARAYADNPDNEHEEQK